MKKKLHLLIITLLLLNSCNNVYDSEAFTNPINCATIVYMEGLAHINNEAYTGACIVYTEDNKKNMLLSFVKGISSGKHLGYYYPEEEVEYIGNRKKGEIHGDYIRYHRNGKINISGRLKKGYRIGVWKFYNTEGKLTEEKNYINGVVKDSILYL